MAKKETKDAIEKIMKSKEFHNLVESTLQDMNAMENSLKEAGYDEAEARKKIQQLHFKNLQQMSDPVSASVNILAELKTRIDLDRMTNPESDLVSEKYVRLLDEMRKTIKLVNESQGKVVRHQVNQRDDSNMKGFDFIDVE